MRVKVGDGIICAASLDGGGAEEVGLSYTRAGKRYIWLEGTPEKLRNFAEFLDAFMGPAVDESPGEAWSKKCAYKKIRKALEANNGQPV